MLRHFVILDSILAAAMLTTCAAADTLVLSEEVFVKGPSVLLGDVAKIEGEHAEVLASIEVAPAAQPGDAKRLNAGLIEARLRGAGVDPGVVRVEGARTVTARTLSFEVPRDMVAASLRQYIEREMPWDAADTEIDIVPPAMDYVVSDGDVTIEWRPSPQYEYVGAGTFRGAILVDGEAQKNVICRASVESYVDVVIAAVDIPRGQPISLSHLALQKVPRTSLKPGAFFELEEAAGLVSRKTLFPGQVITARDTMPRTLIKRNQIVPVYMQAGGLHIQTRARATHAAAAGETAVLANIESGVEYVGRVREDGVVVID